ncbi:MAG: Holliday junction branch migration protein RuvA [Chloroflexota bacterium]
MIEAIRGIVETCQPDTDVLRLGYVSIRVAVTAETARGLRPGDHASLFTHLYLREDLVALYGFASAEERSLFEELMGVTGVGPKAALGFLSTFTPQGLRDAIEQEDLTRLIRVPGVGRKTAQRVVLELKGRLGAVGGAAPTPVSPRDQDLVSVLSGLGYTAAEAAAALQHSNEVASSGTDEDRIRAALGYFAAR